MMNSNIKISLSFHPFFSPAPANGPAGARVISVTGAAEIGLTLVCQKNIPRLETRELRAFGQWQSGGPCSAFLQTQFTQGAQNLAVTDTIVHP